MTKRYKLRFPSPEAMEAAQAIESPNAVSVLENTKRAYLAVEIPDAPEESIGADALEQAVQVAPELQQFREKFGAEILEDYQYELENPGDDFNWEDAVDKADAWLPQATSLIKTDAAWYRSNGRGVTIAVVDTGVDGSHPEFPDSKRAGHWEPPGDDPWTDWHGHGTMCAAISTASDFFMGSRYRGVAPDSKLIPCKTRFYDSELGAVYDYLIEMSNQLDGPLVATNGFGLRTGTPPPEPGQSDFIDALNDAIAAGVFVFFSAGNNHQIAGGSPTACEPNSIWLHKSRADIFSVAACDLQKNMWYYSSRGPGQHFGEPNTSRKPDATAPTPKNGKILYGDGERILPNGWGTSGACSQAAGLAALLLSINRNLDRDTLFNFIRNNARDLGFAHDCQGHGLIDCHSSICDLREQMNA